MITSIISPEKTSAAARLKQGLDAIKAKTLAQAGLGGAASPAPQLSSGESRPSPSPAPSPAPDGAPGTPPGSVPVPNAQNEAQDTSVKAEAVPGSQSPLTVVQAPLRRTTGDPKLPFRKSGKDYHHPDMEVVVLSFMINLPKEIPGICKTLSDEHFFVESNNLIFRAIIYLYNQNSSVSAVTVLQHLKDTQSDFDEDWALSVDACAGTAFNPKYIGLYVKRLQKAASVRLSGGTVLPDRFSEATCAELLRVRIGDVKCVGSVWYRYKDGAWQKTERHIYRRFAAEAIAPAYRQSKRVMDVLTLAESAVQDDKNEFYGAYKQDGRRILINANNCTIEVEPDGKVSSRPHSKADGFTAKLAANYDPDAQCTQFMTTLSKILPDGKDEELLQVFAGYVLMPSCKYEVALTCFGEGGTGKSTIVEAIGEVLGAGVRGACSLEELCKESGYSLPTLKLKMLNLAPELQGTEIETSANFKKLVSGEPLNVREIYKSPEEMRTTCKQIFLTNHMPQFKRGSNAEERRLRLLHFKVTPDIPNPWLKDELRTEISGIFNWMLEGLTILLNTGQVPLGGDDAQELMADFHKNNDPVKTFLEEMCQLSPNDEEIPKQTLFREFGEWHGSASEKMEGFFFKRLREIYPHLREVRRSINGRRERSLVGLRLRD